MPYYLSAIDNDAIENETKIKSLQLRLHGQLKTIKNLETKLSSSVAELEDRSVLLVEAQKKLLSIDRKEKIKYRGDYWIA